MGALADLLSRTGRHIEQETTRTPDREYVVLFLARTGSSHLTSLLTSGGVAEPREWLNPNFAAGQAEAFGARTFDEYFTRMRSRFSPGGAFGHEMTIEFYRDWSAECRLEDWFRFDVPAVFLFREDIVEQAVSVAFAVYRQFYHKTQDDLEPLSDVPYMEGEIRACVENFVAQENDLLAFAETQGATTRFLTYEALTEADPKTVVAAIADHVGISPQLDKVASHHRKLGDARNLDQASRFIAANRAFCRELRQRRRLVFEALQRAPLL